jgi:hypothetical protein
MVSGGLVGLAQERGFEVDIIDLSRLTSEYGRVICPCKACVSTSQALCHWPCSCYPNFAMGQVNDWMSEIYPLWAAHDGFREESANAARSLINAVKLQRAGQFPVADADLHAPREK